jgi:hypothetical protein
MAYEIQKHFLGLKQSFSMLKQVEHIVITALGFKGLKLVVKF